MAAAPDSLGGTRAEVLVVGGTSFVASHLLPRLVERRLAVFATRRDGHAARPDGVRWIDGDLASPHATAQWPAQVDTVIYLAQSRRWRSFPDGAADVFDINVAGVCRAAEYARTAGATRFIVASTGSVYEARLDASRETDPIDITAPRHFYVAAKMAAELLLGAYREAMHVITLRLFVPYGPGQSHEMLIPRLIERVRTGQPIELDGAAGMRINPVAVADVVEAVERSLGLDASVTLNVAGPEILSLRQVGEHIGAVLNRTPVFEARGGDERALLGDTNALADALRWRPTMRFSDSLKRWLRAEP